MVIVVLMQGYLIVLVTCYFFDSKNGFIECQALTEDIQWPLCW